MAHVNVIIFIASYIDCENIGIGCTCYGVAFYLWIQKKARGANNNLKYKKGEKMKTMMKLSVMVLMGSSILFAGTNLMQKYDVKSGKIEYELKGSGNVMGVIQTQSIGKKRVIFDMYGAKELEETVKIETQTTMGETKKTKTHTLNYMNQATIYKVDFEKKIINRMKNTGVQMAAVFGGGKSLKETGESMMKKMGGKKIGTENILGYTCELWDLMGVKQCMYKGIALKIESNMMGMRNVEVATKAEFDIALSEKSFKLPDFPVYEYDIDSLMEGKKPILLDKSKLVEMDKQANVQASVDAKKGAEAMKGMVAGMAALKESGVDLNSGKDLTPEQEEIMKKAMMKAMGGEAKIVEDMKREIFKDANSEAMQFAKECFGNANTLKEANICVDKGNEKFHEDEEYYSSWTAKDKKEMIDEIAQFEKSIPCIKAAHTMQAMEQCLPGMKK